MNSKISLNSEDDQPQSEIRFSQIGTVVSIDNIPNELKPLVQWTLWIGKRRKNGKIDKVPYRADDPYAHAKINKPHTFSSFQCALDSLIEYEDELERISAQNGCPGSFGLMFALTDEDKYVGIDLDDAIDTETGEISDDAIAIIRKLNSYTEFSPSGTGVHILVKGKLPGTGLNRDDIEMYDRVRFLTVTGNAY